MRTWAPWVAGVAAAASMASAPAIAQGYDSYPGGPPPGQGTYAPQPQPPPAYQDAQDDEWNDDALDQMSFRGTLRAYGEWLFVPGVGRVWRPYERVVGADFQPYSSAGHWVYTDYGWTWESDYPWGWAPFHYGRWVYRPRLGWVWRPGRQWGPAWVEWREGAGYVGWSPMAPEGVTVIEAPSRSHWCFVESSNLISLRLPSVILAPERARITFGTTTAIRARRSYDVGTFYLGPPVAHVATAVGHPIHSVGQHFSPHDPFRGRMPDRGPVVTPPPAMGMGRSTPPPGMGMGRALPPPPSQPVYVPPPPGRDRRGDWQQERREDRREDRREERHERQEERREKQEERREQREDRHDDHDNGRHGGDRRHER